MIIPCFITQNNFERYNKVDFLQKRRFYIISTILLYFLGFFFSFALFLSIGPLAPSEPFYSIKPGIDSAISIIIRNLFVCMIMIAGLFMFAIPTILILILNGFWLGGAVSSLLLEGNSFISIAMSIIPHGILEIPGLLLAGFIGMNGLRFYMVPKKVIKSNLKPLLICIILIVISGFIEGFYTLGINS